MTIGIFKEWLVKYFFVHKILLKAILHMNDFQVSNENMEKDKIIDNGNIISWHKCHFNCSGELL
jgi:hypothetical protein